MEIDGQCHCGQVTYRADIEPEKVSVCHCTDCQSLTGFALSGDGDLLGRSNPHDGEGAEGLCQDRR
jgi:hypothetical protein